MKKTKVIIASMLKPIDDTRMFEKFGLSMVETNKYEVNIIGFDSKNAKVVSGIVYHPIKAFERTSPKRFLQPFKTFRKYLKVKPEIIIVNTDELLLVTALYKILFGCRLIYDIRENYWKNILHSGVFSASLKLPIACWVRLKEWLSKPFVNHYMLAERVYEKQLPFLSKHSSIIENKYAPQPNESTAYRQPKAAHLNLVFTGTISTSNGVFEAIEITKALHQIDPSVRLRIVGYCALKKDLLRLQEAIEDLDFIELNGGDHLVPHLEILEAIQKADFGFVMKKPNRGTNDEKILTRLFEYTANHLPIILLNNPHWIRFCEQFNAALVVDPHGYSAQKLWEDIKSTHFYDRGDTKQSLWDSEKDKLLQAIEA